MRLINTITITATACCFLVGCNNATTSEKENVSIEMSADTEADIEANIEVKADIDKDNDSKVNITSLDVLSIEALKRRAYQTRFKPVKELHNTTTKNEYTSHFANHNPSYNPSYSAILNYKSDGLSLYSRIDIPSTPAPEKGFPVVVFVHGWVGLKNANSYDFSYNTESNYANVIQEFVQAGFVVLTPGLRGHGTVNGVVADGTEFIETWDNGSYTSPLFYSIDVLNLLGGIETLNDMPWLPGSSDQPQLSINSQEVNIFGHSQGGDVVLTTLAVTGENAALKQNLNAGAIWAGCFLPRTEQLRLYGPMGSTTEAFLSGDGAWTGSAKGKNGQINPDFTYPYPADWIGTPDNSNNTWTWQTSSWPVPSVKLAVDNKLKQMYDTFNQHVGNIENAKYTIESDSESESEIESKNVSESGSESEHSKGIKIVHDKRIASYLSAMDAFSYPQYITEKIAVHHSDRDYYSPSEWNEKLVTHINNSGGTAIDYEYVGNTHSMKVSPHLWFSPKGTVAGFEQMMKRNIALFSE